MIDYVHFRHLIGFFIFLALTIYTATQVPNAVDIRSLQHLPDVLRKADIHKIQAELVSCLPSLPHLSDLQKLKDELKTSWNSMEVLPSLSRWHLLELLANCLPHRFTHPNETSLSVLVSSLQLAELLDYILLLLLQGYYCFALRSREVNFSEVGEDFTSVGLYQRKSEDQCDRSF